MQPHMVEGVETYLFDLDNTLYHASTGLMDAMVQRIQDYVVEYYGVSMEEAEHIRKSYWANYGTTLAH